jgi:signal transduction histidine kinase
MALVRQMTKGANAGVDRALERVDRNIDRCTRIIGDLLEFTHQRELTREPTAIDRWVTEMLDQQPVAEGIALRRELLCGEQVAIDRERFRQVMVNLLDNAAQALSDPAWRAPAGHERIVTVRTETAEPHVRLSVIDTGPGMAADKLPQIFEPLFTTKGFGVGLGLPTARQIIEQHGGTIDVESRVGEGAAFIIWLPRYVAETARGAAAA